MITVSPLAPITSWFWRNVTIILLVVLLISFVYIGYQYVMIQYQKVQIEELSGKYRKCQEGLKSSINMSNSIFENHKFDDEYVREREKKCRELLEKSDAPLTEEEVKKLFQ